MDRREWAHISAKLWACYPQAHPTEDTIAAYFDALGHFGAQEVGEALSELVSESRYFPTVADILSALRRQKAERREQWPRFEEAEEAEPRQRKIGCAACRDRGVSGRLLPARKGTLRCFSCKREVEDRWDLATADAASGIYDSYAQFARQLWEMRERFANCSHSKLAAGQCAQCGLPSEMLPGDHWSRPAIGGAT